MVTDVEANRSVQRFLDNIGSVFTTAADEQLAMRYSGLCYTDDIPAMSDGASLFTTPHPAQSGITTDCKIGGLCAYCVDKGAGWTNVDNRALQLTDDNTYYCVSPDPLENFYSTSAVDQCQSLRPKLSEVMSRGINRDVFGVNNPYVCTILEPYESAERNPLPVPTYEYSVTDLIIANDKYCVGDYDRSTLCVELSIGKKIPVEVIQDWKNGNFEHRMKPLDAE
jgi:hypothetical protein